MDLWIFATFNLLPACCAVAGFIAAGLFQFVLGAGFGFCWLRRARRTRGTTCLRTLPSVRVADITVNEFSTIDVSE